MAAFSAGNLKAVAESVRKKLSNAKLVVAGDDDAWTEGNPGRTKAVEAAQALKAQLVLPHFPSLSSRPTDFNDLLLLCGVEEVRKQLEPAGLGALLDSLVGFIRRFVFMSESQARVVALWVAHTHAFDAAEATPYLAVTSAEKRSGKSRLLEVLEVVVTNPWFTGRVTAAVLTRKVDAEHPTVLLDESDAAFAGEKDYAEALRGVLNTGHRRGGKASCCVGQGARISYRDFSTFCPKAIAGIGKLPGTVSDRAIPIRLKRAAPGERAERFRVRKVKPEADRLHAALEAWAAATEGLRDAEPALPGELTDRQQDGAEPLLSIAEMAGGAWPEAARAALIKLCAEGQVGDDSVGARLLADIRQIFEQHKTDRLASTDLVEALGEIETSPWGEWAKGKPVSQTGLAKLLRPFEISPRSIRIGENTPKGYLLEQFQDAFQRYVPVEDSGAAFSSPGGQNATPPHDSTEAASAHFSKRNTEGNVAAAECETPNKDGICGGVADLTPGMGAETEGNSEPKPFLEGFL